MFIVIRIGGSVVASPLNSTLIGRYAQILTELINANHRVVVVIGGGSLARDLIKICENLGLDENAQDRIAIKVSKLYAFLLLLKLGNHAVGEVPSSTMEVIRATKTTKLVIMGGLEPGMTTDTVAAQIARIMKADLLVKATDQNGIYTKDPKKYKNAEKLAELTFNELSRIFEQQEHKAGIHQIIDPVAVRILQENNITTVVVNGFDPKNVLEAIEGRKVGTKITE